MWKLFANLLEALRERHLPHYFVRSYNLFGIDYIEDLAILESLTRRVDPVKFAEELIRKRSPVQEQEQMNSPSNQLQSELMLFSPLKKGNTEGVGRKTVERVCLGMIKDLPKVIDNSLDEDEQELVLTEMKCFVKEIIDELYKNEELEDDIPLD